jgi:hypothetical protein
MENNIEFFGPQKELKMKAEFEKKKLKPSKNLPP